MNTFNFDSYLIGGQYTLDGKLIEGTLINDYPSAHCIYDIVSSHEEIPHNCVNCGAILTGNKCEYCGTKY